MNCQQLVEEKVGSVLPARTKYLWFDADTLIYLCALRDAYLDLPLECAPFLVSKAMDRLKATAERKLGHPVVFVNCLSTSHTFRHDINPDYKSNRVGKWRPPLLATYIEAFKELYPYILVDGYEADDLVGILHHNIPGHVLCSGDKDLKQFPGLHFNPRTEEVYTITEQESIDFRLYQWLVGDSADGYPGAYLIGDKKAKRIIEELEGEPFKVMVDEINGIFDAQNQKAEAKGRPPQDAEQNFQMSQIRCYFGQEEIPDKVLFLASSIAPGQTYEDVSEIQSDTLCDSGLGG